MDKKYFKTGITGLDQLFTRGIPVGHSVLVEGGPGCGKTVFCLNVAYNALKQGNKVLYMSFEEPEKNLISHMKGFNFDVDKYLKNGKFYLERFSAIDVARSVEALLSAAKHELLIDVQPVLIPEKFKPDVVLIDSLSSIASAFSGEEYRFRIYMEQLFRYLERYDITSFLIRETARPTHIGLPYAETGEAVSFLSDGIICLYSAFYRQGFRKRAIEIIKMRGEEFKNRIVEMEIKNRKGIVVYPNRALKGDYILT